MRKIMNAFFIKVPDEIVKKKKRWMTLEFQFYCPFFSGRPDA